MLHQLKKLNVLDLIILGLFIITFLTWLYCDILKTYLTPLTYFGMNHWIPECLLMFCIGWDTSDWLKHWFVDMIAILTFLLPVIHYGLSFRFAESIFGIGAGCLFSGLFLLGIWFGKKKPL